MCTALSNYHASALHRLSNGPQEVFWARHKWLTHRRRWLTSTRQTFWDYLRTVGRGWKGLDTVHSSRQRPRFCPPAGSAKASRGPVGSVATLSHTDASGSLSLRGSFSITSMQ